MKSRDDVWEMIEESRRMPHGPSRIALVEEALRHVDGLGDTDLAFAGRLAAVSAYGLIRPAEMLTAFSWCLTEFNRDPDRRSAWEAGSVRFYFNHALIAMAGSPEIPLDRIHAVLDDMDALYHRGGHRMHCVYRIRWNVASSTGDLDAMEHWYRRWVTAECDTEHGCFMNAALSVAHLSDFRRDEEAVAIGLPVLTGEVHCDRHTPRCLSSGMFTELMLPCLRTGRWAEAARAHREAYRQLAPIHQEGRGDIADLDDLAANLHFCGLTGNERRGVEIIERHADSLSHAPTPMSEMEYAAAAALVLRRAAHLGHPEVRTESGTLDAATMGRRLAERATAIAARFDARNGNTHISDQVTAVLTAEPLIDHLVLS